MKMNKSWLVKFYHRNVAYIHKPCWKSLTFSDHRLNHGLPGTGTWILSVKEAPEELSSKIKNCYLNISYVLSILIFIIVSIVRGPGGISSLARPLLDSNLSYSP